MQISSGNGLRGGSFSCVILVRFFLIGLLASPILAWGADTLATIPVGKGPGQLVVNPSAHLVYVVNQNDNSVSIIDSELLTVKKVIKVGAGPTAIAMNPLLGAAYVADTAAGRR